MSMIQGVGAAAPSLATPSSVRPPASAEAAPPSPAVVVEISAEARALAAGGLPLFATADADGTAEPAVDRPGKDEQHRKWARDHAGSPQDSLGKERHVKAGSPSAAGERLSTVEVRMKADSPTKAPAEGATETAGARIERVIKAAIPSDGGL